MESADDEDDGNQGGKVFLGEAGNVADVGASVGGHEDEEDETGPEADPQAERQVVPAQALAGGVDNRLKDEDRSGGTEDGEWLGGEHAIEGANDEARDKRFHRCDVVFCRVAEQPAKGDNGCEAGKVDEDVGSHALHGYGILEVCEIPRLLPLDVVDESSEEPACTRQTSLLPHPLLLLLLVDMLGGLRGMFPALLGGHRVGRLNPDAGVPLPGGQHGHGVQELVQPGQQVVALLGLVGHVVEHLVRHHRGDGSANLVVLLDATLKRLVSRQVKILLYLQRDPGGRRGTGLEQEPL